MRAVQVSKFGGPEVLEVVEVQRPESRAGEVLIKVSRAGINFADVHGRTNEFGESSYLTDASLPFSPGLEVVGSLVDGGERVVALTGGGGYAEYVVARADLTFPAPAHLTDDIAVGLLIQGLTAWHLLTTSTHLAPGENLEIARIGDGVALV